MRRALFAVLAAFTAIALGRGLAIWMAGHYPIVVTVISIVVVVVVWDRELSDRRTLR